MVQVQVFKLCQESVYQWRGLSRLADAWLDLGPDDGSSEVRGWAAEDYCGWGGWGGGDWTWGWLGALTLLDEGSWVWGELPQSWETSLQRKTGGQTLQQRRKNITLLVLILNENDFLPRGKAQGKVGVRSWALCTICWWIPQLPVCLPSANV